MSKHSIQEARKEQNEEHMEKLIKIKTEKIMKHKKTNNKNSEDG